jgi:hypothetical protein
MLDVDAEDTVLALETPAAFEHLRAVRLVAADAAERAGFDCDETDDLRIGVDELVHAAMRCARTSVRTTFEVEPGGVVVRGAAERRPGSPECRLSWLSERIVAAVADLFGVSSDGSQVRFVLTKRSR